MIERKGAAVRAEALAFALAAAALRRLHPNLRPLLPPSRVALVWELRRLALRRAEERRARERRRRRIVAAAALSTAAGVALAGARALAARH